MARPPADDDAEEDDNGHGEKLSQDILRKYLIYARTHCRPQVSSVFLLIATKKGTGAACCEAHSRL